MVKSRKRVPRMLNSDLRGTQAVRLRSISQILLTLFVIGGTSSASAQTPQFQPRERSVDSAGQSAGVSSDLLAIYQRTKTAETEKVVTDIARACSKVIPDSARSQQDRDYASSLFAWALNRRGEMRSDRAAKLVDSGQLAEADALDRRAADDFETAIKYGPDNWRTHHNYAISLAMKGDYPTGIKVFSKAIELKPDYANAYFNRGELYFELEQFDEAIRDYSQAISLVSDDPQYYNSRGHAHFMLEQHQAALDDYRSATEHGPDSSTYHTDLADALQYLGQWADAAVSYREAIAANQQNPRAYQNAAWLMATCPAQEIRNPALALSAAEKAIELGGQRSARALDTLAAAKAAAGKQAEAVKWQRQALRLAGEDEEAEMQQRLKLYLAGKTYRQPRAMSARDTTPDIGEYRVRTASRSGRSSP